MKNHLKQEYKNRKQEKKTIFYIFHTKTLKLALKPICIKVVQAKVKM